MSRLAILSLLVLAFAPACHKSSGEGEGEGEGEEVRVDADGDGFTVGEGDCDDAEPTASPAQAEICDGLDNDCDDAVDEAGAVGESVVYTDGDGDGYGAGAALSETACPSAGLSVFDTDCDDADATVSPGVSEVCADELDNDCDAEVDEVDAVDATWWPDHDGDGYGNAAGIPEEGCEKPVGYVLNDTDCDDNDVLQSPGALDARNGVDDDCDGETDEAPGEFDGWLRFEQGDVVRTYTTHGTLVEDHACEACEWLRETTFLLTDCTGNEALCAEEWEKEEADPGRLMASPWFGYGAETLWQSLEVDGDYDDVGSASWDPETGLLSYVLKDTDSLAIYGEALVY